MSTKARKCKYCNKKIEAGAPAHELTRGAIHEHCVGKGIETPQAMLEEIQNIQVRREPPKTKRRSRAQVS